MAVEREMVVGELLRARCSDGSRAWDVVDRVPESRGGRSVGRTEMGSDAEGGDKGATTLL